MPVMLVKLVNLAADSLPSPCHMPLSQWVPNLRMFLTFHTSKDIWLALYYLVFVLSCLFGFLVTWYWAWKDIHMGALFWWWPEYTSTRLVLHTNKEALISIYGVTGLASDKLYASWWLAPGLKYQLAFHCGRILFHIQSAPPSWRRISAILNHSSVLLSPN